MALSPLRLLAGYIFLVCLLRVTFHLGETTAGPLTLAGIVAVAALQLPISLSGGRGAALVLLPAQAVLNYVPLLAEPESWRAGGSAFVVASVLLVVGGPWAWSLVALIVAVEAGAAVALDLPPVMVYYAIVAPLNGGLMLYGLSRLSDLVDRARRERSELAARAGEVERLRLWGHVHGLVVSSVSAAERLARLARRGPDPEAVRRIVVVAREALERVRSLPSADEAIPVPPHEDDRRVLRLATPILVVTHLLFIGQSIFNFAADGSEHLALLALLPVTFGLQFWHLVALRAGARPRVLAWTLAAQALVIHAPLLRGHTYGLIASGFFAGVVLLHVRARVSWPLCAAICGVTALASWPQGPAVAVYQFCSTLATALAVYGLTRLAALVTELRRTRAELVELAALRERLKVGRDVHDLLGRGLTTIVLHGELALRLLATDPSRAADQLDRLAAAARAALLDTARLSAPDRLSLADEIDSARAVLESAGATVHIDAAPVTHPLLAVVLREAVTNVLRHSTPSSAVIEIGVEDGRVRLRVANDGATTAPGEPGTGLRNLRARLADAGGELTVTRAGDRFELLARTPVDHEDLTPAR